MSRLYAYIIHNEENFRQKLFVNSDSKKPKKKTYKSIIPGLNQNCKQFVCTIYTNKVLLKAGYFTVAQEGEHCDGLLIKLYVGLEPKGGVVWIPNELLAKFKVFFPGIRVCKASIIFSKKQQGRLYINQYWTAYVK